MGVTGLWQILHPCARPIKLETLNRKRLAVDASIWIYQFLKAVRDKEGNALRNSHVVGFFRRICKLLFFGIKPVFVFDGGAPVLKRQTVTERKKRREGRRDDAVRTAGKLLAVQMQRRAEEEEQRRKDDNERGPPEEVVPDDALVYVDEFGMSQEERQQTRRFKKKDQYHLPDLNVNLNEMGGPNDPRIMSLEELQSYAKQFETGDDINVYDFSKIDYDSAFFMSLPASDRYNILNAARLRSRLRMGHSKEQLDTMFPDRMAFSKFQIERVTERNELTQRLMHLNESGGALFNGGGRVAGEKGREYVLVKNDGVEGGWALGVIGDEGTKQETAIDLDKPAPVVKATDEWEDEDEFEDVPIEGLNRLPKRSRLETDVDVSDALAQQRRAFYQAKKSGSGRKTKPKPRPNSNSNSLFVQEDANVEDEWEDATEDNDDGEAEAEDEDLRQAIALSLENEDARRDSDVSEDDMLDVFQQSAAPEARPLPKGSGRAIANMVNKRAFHSAPDSREITSFGVPRPISPDTGTVTDDNNGNEEDTLDLQAALAESRRTKRKVGSPRKEQRSSTKPIADSAKDVAKQAGFSGPLPFEKLDLGTSLLGKKKMQERSEEAAGGFINPDTKEKEQRQNAEPLPPWFSEDPEHGIQRQRELEKEELAKARELRKQFQFDDRGDQGLMKRTNEVIDLEADDVEDTQIEYKDVIDLEVENDGQSLEIDGGQVFDPELRMGDIGEKVLLEPPRAVEDDPYATARRDSDAVPQVVNTHQDELRREELRSRSPAASSTMAHADNEGKEDEEMLEWSESEDENENDRIANGYTAKQGQSAAGNADRDSRSPSADFEDVAIPDKPGLAPATHEDDIQETEDDASGPVPASGLAHQDSIPEDAEFAEFDDFSDPEDEDLLRQLTIEAEEHARFASTLNNKSQAQNIADYEKELKQLRNQQKKDRRDADEVTHIMISECQQLLRLFGLPYVTAPMEAEAQCAELVKLGLVDGIVTDDSDCFLFGGTRIYKNMFNQAKFVECYLSSDLEKEFDLRREKLIQIAHLLGSDYTEGLPGVGPVTSLEILSEFPTLQDFKDWWSGVQMNTIPKSDDQGNAFRKKFRRQATKLFLPPTFPDVRVDVAYQQPEIDSDPEVFQWGVPDLDALRSFLMATIGWSQERTDEVLVPVIRDMNRRADEGTQSNITAFFDGGVGIGSAGAGKASAKGEAFAPRRVAATSKRMGSALSRMANKAKRNRDGSTAQEINGEDRTMEYVADEPKSRKRKKPGAQQKPNDLGDSDLAEEDEDECDVPVTAKKQRKRSKKPRR